MRFPKNLAFVLLLFVFDQARAQIITTFAGNIQDSFLNATGYYRGGFSGDGRPATAAQFSMPCRIRFDAVGNMYVVDNQNWRIRKIDTTGITSTIAGNGTLSWTGDNGPATAAGIGTPTGVAIDKLGNVYIASGYSSVDGYGGYIRKVDTAGIITTIAGNGTHIYSGDGPATATGFDNIEDIVIDGSNNIYVADLNNVNITRITPNGMINTICGDGFCRYSGDGGPASSASLSYPHGLAIDTVNNIYISDGTRIRKINTTGIITTIAGDGTTWNGDTDNVPATATQIRSPRGLVVDTVGNVYFADKYSYIVRRVAPTGIITTIAGKIGAGWGNSGDDGPATAAMLTWPSGLAFDKNNNLYIVDAYNLNIRKITDLPMIPTPLSVVGNTADAQSFTIDTWPVPNNGTFKIITHAAVKEQVDIIITDIAGKKVQDLVITTNTNYQMQLNAMPGIYIITAQTQRGKQTSKMIVR